MLNNFIAGRIARLSLANQVRWTQRWALVVTHIEYRFGIRLL